MLILFILGLLVGLIALGAVAVAMPTFPVTPGG